MCVHGSVTGSEGFCSGFVWQTVAPSFQHVEAFGMPNVCLKPLILPLSAIKLQKQVAMTTTSFATPAFGQLFLLFLCLLTALNLNTQAQNQHRYDNKNNRIPVDTQHSTAQHTNTNSFII